MSKDARQLLLDQVEKMENEIPPQELLDAICILMVLYAGNYGLEKDNLLSAVGTTWDMMEHYEAAMDHAMFTSGVAGEA